MRWLDRIIDSMDMNLSKLREMVKARDTVDPGKGGEILTGLILRE